MFQSALRCSDLCALSASETEAASVSVLTAALIKSHSDRLAAVLAFGDAHKS